MNSREESTKFIDNKPGDKWFAGFLQRHPSLKMKRADELGDHLSKFTEDGIRSWFTHCQQTLQTDGYDIIKTPPANIFNCDETGFPFSIQVY